jgi:hypothetical protein
MDSLVVFTPLGPYRPEVVPTTARVAPYPQGDVNVDGYLTSTDIISMVGYVFKSAPLAYPDLGDVNGDVVVNSADVIYMVNYIFRGGPPPVG